MAEYGGPGRYGSGRRRFGYGAGWPAGGPSAGYRGRGPRGYVRSDERIREDVSDFLTDDPYLDASDIEVVVGNGEVTLNGTVDSRTAKRRAEDIAANVSGVRHVQNNLHLRDDTSGLRVTRGATGAVGAL